MTRINEEADSNVARSNTTGYTGEAEPLTKCVKLLVDGEVTGLKFTENSVTTVQVVSRSTYIVDEKITLLYLLFFVRPPKQWKKRLHIISYGF